MRFLAPAALILSLCAAPAFAAPKAPVPVQAKLEKASFHVETRRQPLMETMSARGLEPVLGERVLPARREQALEAKAH